MSALSDKGITLEGLAAAVDALRQELATWKALAHKQDRLSADQITATQSGATAAKISQIAVNTAAIQSLAAQVAGQISLEYVTTLPATGEPLTLYLVPQGDGTAPNFCNEYLWVNDAWELIGTTGAMANNGELVIQVNGVAVGTFTANQAANAAVNITVPTNTNQLVNGAQFVDAAALQAALLLKQNNLTAVQLEAVNSGITAAAVQQIADNATAISGKQDALTVAQQAAVDSGATAAKIDQIAANASAIVSLTSSKQDALSATQLAAVNSGITASAVQQIGTNADNIASLTSSKQDALSATQLAAVNSGVTAAAVQQIADNATAIAGKQDALSTTQLAAVNSGVTASAVQQIGTNADNISGLQTAVASKAADNSVVHLAGAETITGDKTWTGINAFTSPVHAVTNQSVPITVNPSAEIVGNNFRFTDNTRFWGQFAPVWGTDGSFRIELGISNWTTTGGQGYWAVGTKVSKDFGTLDFYTSHNNANLGTSSNKWKTLNGINPGALSLPSPASAMINISSSITNLDGTTNSYTPEVNGWLALRVNNATGNYIYVQQGSAGHFTRVDSGGGGANLYLLFPVRADTAVTILIVAQSGLIARLYPCLGNV